MNTKKRYAWLVGAVLVLAVAASLYLTVPQQAPAEHAPAAQPQVGAISLTVQGLYRDKQVAITEGETALQVLQALDKQDPQLQLAAKEYPHLGVLVTSMHGMQNGAGGDYWQYKVNGAMPQVGAGAYQLRNGDSVEWFFAASQE